jgi:hypothetical protein
MGRSNKLNILGLFAHYFTGPAVSVFGGQLEHTDAQAFAALRPTILRSRHHRG